MALRQRGLAKHVVGVGRRRPAALEQALELGAIDEASEDLAIAAAGADLAIICTPVQYIVEHAQVCLAAMPDGGLVTDVGSTKRTISEAFLAPDNQATSSGSSGSSCIPGDPSTSGISLIGAAGFCGSHPLAGSDRSGVEHAEPDLLDGKLVIVTPTPNIKADLVERTEALWQSLGSKTLQLSPETHDQAIARTSHLPHLVASALAAATPEELLPLVASGWRDTTRVAAGNVDMWLQIVAENRAEVLASLEGFADHLQTWLNALRAPDSEQLEQLLTAGKQQRDRVGN